ncbi:NAD-dependent epimerase/dehydratase family protein [Roseisolibacter agri]|uniref:CDP-glucose 4,6-dehydratase n=1 Tax=Roseisolibacter agri TaxID=2014610 RepID=A0AA37V1S1_9BACT|nr:NAD-dependent epimerase/dehydratase family protein [Roseisolibacter agri]GLC26695.1 CDP-glucose 4,6-dehydratase [Roseisolibacter agri]
MTQPATRTPGFWRDRPTLVTGATGLLGGWLVRALVDAGADVVCLVRDWVPASAVLGGDLAHRVRVVRGEIQDQALVERTLGEYEIDCVFHLAAQTVVGTANRNPVSTFDSNVRGTWTVLEACRRSPLVRAVVFASSDKAYGAHDTLPYAEDAALQGRHPYDVSKSCADLIAQSYAATYGTPVAITRCGNFYGGGDLNWNRLVPGTVRSVLRGERPVIRSDGTLVRDYFYVEDGVAAYLELAEALRARPELAGEAFNFSNELQVTVLDMTRRILEALGSDLEPDVRDEARHEIPHQWLSAEKARRVLGWRPHYTLDEGMARTVAWYREFFRLVGS